MDVIFVRDIGELDTTNLIEAEFKRLNVAYHRTTEPDWLGRPVANFYSINAASVSDSLDDKGVPHEYGYVSI